MIFLHLIIGLILGKVLGNFWFFVIGSIFPDIDHIYIVIKNKLFSWKKYIDSLKNEKKYGLRYKTAFVHSLFGLTIFSLMVCLINIYGGIAFALAYFLHLIIDWIDIDEKYYLYPNKKKFSGFLPIWSSFEKIITVIALIALICVHLRAISLQ
jgi:hypothetical protein